ncbi:Cilia- and flagella-associated protein 47 [Geodia barretti]|uniref:Cilia- and flagella-associated protein 47 n=1 Tax=Geodia barretti TaxID=519541 RepID=A0AA35TG94_GEOBA|nr:Cilia- and flagella-associated protein 47 [Geodia barretti]
MLAINYSVNSLPYSQGTLLPYEKRILELTIGPRFISSDSGWSHFQATPTRRDYTLYLRFLAVDTNRESTASGGDLEVAVCATALPVDVQLEPSPPLQFGATPTMSPTTQHVKVHNKSDTLPLYFTTHRVPHYTCHPPSGHIPPSHTLTLSLTFTPKQLGPLNARLLIDILTSDSRSGKEGGIVKTLVVDLRGEGVSPGPGGRGRGDESGSNINYAHPDDMATSIRPYDGYQVVTPYTRTPRYTYVDRDYAYSEAERREIQWHRDHYLHYLRHSQALRLWNRRERALVAAACGPERELGLLPLKAPSNSPTVSSDSSARWRKKRRGRGAGKPGIMTTDDVTTATSVDLREVEQCSTTAESQQAASEVNAALSPYQLSLITICPGVLDYGVIAVSSVVEKTVTIKNSLNQHICFTFKLAGSGVKSPLFPSSSSSSSSSSHLVLPPLSYTNLPFTIHRDTTGLLERCVECLVNTRHVVRLPVRVETVPSPSPSPPTPSPSHNLQLPLPLLVTLSVHYDTHVCNRVVHASHSTYVGIQKPLNASNVMKLCIIPRVARIYAQF